MPIGVKGVRVGPQKAFRDSVPALRKAKKLKLKYYALSLSGKHRTAWRISQIGVRKALEKETKQRFIRKQERRQLAITRLDGACREHGLIYNTFIHNMARHNIMLNRFVMAEMAVSEPRTFRALTELSLSRQTAGLNDISFMDGYKNTRIIVGPTRPHNPVLNRKGQWADLKEYRGNPLFDHLIPGKRLERTPTERVGNHHFKYVTV